jgi:hypothetical protein
VQRLPSAAGTTKPQKYLIETNPVLTNLKRFMSSDYLLSKLSYDPDASAKRLGDGCMNGVSCTSPEYPAGVSKLQTASQLIGALTAAAMGGDASAAAEVAANVTQYNNLDHPSAERLLNELQGCRATKACSE